MKLISHNRPNIAPCVLAAFAYLTVFTACAADPGADDNTTVNSGTSAGDQATSQTSAATGTEAGSGVVDASTTNGATANGATTNDSAATSDGSSTTANANGSTGGPGEPGSVQCGQETCLRANDQFCTICGQLPGELIATCMPDLPCAQGNGAYVPCDGDEDCADGDGCVAPIGSIPFTMCSEDTPELGCSLSSLRTCDSDADCPACASNCVPAGQAQAPENTWYDVFDAIGLQLCTSYMPE